MKRTLCLLIAALSFALPFHAFAQTTALGYPQQCTNNATNPTSAEWLTCTQARAGTSVGNPIYTSPVGGAGAQNQWYTGAAWANWSGQNAGKDALTNSTPAPFVYNLNMVWDSVGSHWDRMTGTVPGTAIGDAMGATPSGAPGISYNSFYDGANFRRWIGGTLTDNYTQPVLPYNASFQMVWDGAKWDRMTQPTGNTPAAVSDAMGALPLGVWSVGINTFYDGANYRRWRGETWDNGIDTVTVAPSVIGLTSFYEGGSAKGYRWTGELWDDGMGYTTNPNVNSFGVFYDAVGAVGKRWSGETWDTAVDQVTVAPSTLSLGTFYNDTANKGYRWHGGLPVDGQLNADTISPYVQSLGMAYDNIAGRWKFLKVADGDSGFGAGTQALMTNGLNFYWDAEYSGYKRWYGGEYKSVLSLPGPGLSYNNPNVNAFNVYWANSSALRWEGERWDTTIDEVLSGFAPNVNALGVFYDVGATKGSRWQGETWDTAIDGVTIAPSVLSLGTFYDTGSSKGYRWTGKALADDGDPPAVVPGVGSYQMVWDGAKWDRMTQPTGGSTVTLADNMGAAPTGVASASYNTFYDGTNFRRWLGAVPADNLGTAMAAPYTLSLGTFYDGTNYRRWTGETWDTAIDNVTVAPATIALNAFYDATTSKGYRWNGGSLTSSIAGPVTGPYVGAIMYGYNSAGPVYYPIKTDATGAYVHMADLLPGEDAVNDWRKVRVESVATYTPGYTDTASVAVAATEVMASTEVLGYSNISFTCKNTGVTNLIDTTYLYISPNGSDWQVIATNTTDIGTGATARVFQISNNSDRYMKLLASANTSTTSARCWLTARVTN